jgi:hypothetical protein
MYMVARECYADIFLLFAVTSREAMITRSRRAWCSSSAVRKSSNIGIYGLFVSCAAGDGAISASGFVLRDESRRGRFGGRTVIVRIMREIYVLLLESHHKLLGL